MTQDDGGYDLKNPPPSPTPPVTTPAPDGSAAPQSSNPSEPGWVPPVPIVEKAAPEAAVSEAEIAEATDISKHKGMAALGYLFFLIPLVAAPNSKFARYHANQSLLLFLLFLVIIVLIVALVLADWLNNKFVTISILHGFFYCGFYLLDVVPLIGWCVMWILGVVNASNGEKKPLPVIGHWTLIK